MRHWRGMVCRIVSLTDRFLKDLLPNFADAGCVLVLEFLHLPRQIRQQFVVQDAIPTPCDS
jgi:hypothetical protein